MGQTSFLRDILVLIGVFPIERPTKVNQVKKRMGYPWNYLRLISEEERKLMHSDSEKLFSLIH